MAENLFMLRMISLRCFRSLRLADSELRRLLLKSRNWIREIAEILLIEVPERLQLVIMKVENLEAKQVVLVNLLALFYSFSCLLRSVLYFARS